MRFTDKKGIKIYCCVSFSPCKVWIKCHTLACELLNELVCSPRCGACKYPSWVWKGGLLSGSWGFTRIGKCRTHLSVAPAIRAVARDRRTKQLYWQAASAAPHLKWQRVGGGKAPLWLLLLVIWGKMTDRHSQNEMIDVHCHYESTYGQLQVWVERKVCECV